MEDNENKPRRSRKSGTDWKLRRLVLIIMAVVLLLIIGAVSMLSGKRTDILAKKDTISPKTVDNVDTETEFEPDTKEYILALGGCMLTEDGEPALTELMKTYFKAVSDCDLDTFMKLFTSQDLSEQEKYQKEFEEQKQYISGYQNIKCYTTPGLKDGEIVAYVYYEVLYTGIETPAPGLVRIYAVQSDDGGWLIDDGEMSDELKHFLEELSVNEDVRLLSKQTDDALKAAMEQDDALRERVEFMKQGASYMQEDQENAD